MIGVLGNIGKIVTGPLELFLETRKLKHEAKAAHLQRIIEGQVEWEATMAKNSGNSWKDEFWTVIFAIPAMMCFIPGLREYAHVGFQQLSQLPDWYTWTMMALVGASVGIRMGPALLSRDKSDDKADK